jgi:hypothetical protein
VTNEDIKRVANTYFAPENRTVLDVVPPAAPAAAAAAPTAETKGGAATKAPKFAAEVTP